jgi:hypothetical protein
LNSRFPDSLIDEGCTAFFFPPVLTPAFPIDYKTSMIIDESIDYKTSMIIDESIDYKSSMITDEDPLRELLFY